VPSTGGIAASTGGLTGDSTTVSAACSAWDSASITHTSIRGGETNHPNTIIIAQSYANYALVKQIFAKDGLDLPNSCYQPVPWYTDTIWNSRMNFQEGKMVQAELLEILRCPYCVSGETRRKDKEDPGRLDLVREGVWLVCQDCGRKYPIRDDIPVMLIDTGSKWIETAVEALPVPPPEE
jgi:hypothetical protein